MGAVKKKKAAPVARDTWPVPPPDAGEPESAEHEIRHVAHDTIRTPPPSPDTELDDIEIPTLRGVEIEATRPKGD
jgi:hypothetical protein